MKKKNNLLIHLKVVCFFRVENQEFLLLFVDEIRLLTTYFSALLKIWQFTNEKSVAVNLLADIF